MNIDVPSSAFSFFSLKFHQVAIYAKEHKNIEEFWSDLGYTAWVKDSATLSGIEWGNESSKRGEMMFNYDILPCELEYVRYSSHTRHSRDDRDGRTPFLSHLSTHVEDLDWELNRIKAETRMEPYHRFTTSDHVNPALIGKKRFREAIFNTRNGLGFDLKLIQRIPWDWKP